MEWFEDKAFWVELYPYLFPEDKIRATDDVERIVRLTGRTMGVLLDVGCGPGKHAAEFARRNFKVTAVERSDHLLDMGRKAAKDRNLEVEWVHKDVREFSRPAGFDLAVSLFSSFTHYLGPEANAQAARRVFESLKPGGIFLADVRGKEIVGKHLQAMSSFEGKEGAIIVQRNHVVSDWTELRTEWVVVKGGKAKTFEARIHLYSGQELRELLLRAGFKDVILYGSLDGASYGLHAARLVAVGRKAADSSVAAAPAKAAAADRAPAPKAAPAAGMLGRLMAAARAKPAKRDEPRPWWRGCGDKPDDEMLAIDALEETIGTLDEETKRIRMATARLRLWHAEAERHVGLVVEAIGKGRADGLDEVVKGAATRPEGQRPPAERLIKGFIDILGAWCMGNVSTVMYLDVSALDNINPVEHLGPPTSLKTWQVRQLVGKLRTSSGMYPSAEYVPMVGGKEAYKENADFYDSTVKAMIHDKVDGKDGEIGLAAAIDGMEAWHWNFTQNLVIILKAVNGNLRPGTPFAVGDRNIRLSPARDRMKAVAATLHAFCEGAAGGAGVDRKIIEALGGLTAVKHWLAASLDKTIRAVLRL